MAGTDFIEVEAGRRRIWTRISTGSPVGTRSDPTTRPVPLEAGGTWSSSGNGSRLVRLSPGGAGPGLTVWSFSGNGSRLVRLFEDRAKQRGCRTFYLTTFSFQAPSFYKALGYHAEAEIRGFPAGIVNFLMTRTVASDEA